MFGWFKNKESERKRAHVYGLLLMCSADGHVHDAEWKFLLGVAAKLGMSQEEVNDMFQPLIDKATREGKISAHAQAVAEYMRRIATDKDYAPETGDQALQQLIDLVYMLLVDGQIDTREHTLCVQYAAVLGFPPTAVPTLLQDIHRRYFERQPPQDAYAGMSAYTRSA